MYYPISSDDSASANTHKHFAVQNALYIEQFD